MKNCFIISVICLFISCISLAQTNSNNVDPFLGSYELGGRADLVWFNTNLNSSGFEIGHGLFSGDTAQQPVTDFQENNSVISTDGVSGNFLMSSVSQQERDEAVLSTMESVGDSLIRVRLYVDQYVNGAWSIVPETIDSLKAKASTVDERMLIRMTSGYFTGGPAKEFAVAYNLPDGSNLITIRVFKLDVTTGRPIQITSVKDDALPATLGKQAFFNITAGNFEGNGRDQLVLIKNNAQIAYSGQNLGTDIISLKFHAYDFDWTTNQLASKDTTTRSWTCPGVNGENYSIIQNRLTQLVLCSGNFNGDGRAECICGFSLYMYFTLVLSPIPVYYPDMYYYVVPFSLNSNLTSFNFNNSNPVYVEGVPMNGQTPSSLADAQMSMVAGDIDTVGSQDGKDELVVSAMENMYVYSLSSSLSLTNIAKEASLSKIEYASHRTIAIADIDGDTTFADSAGANWHPEIVAADFSFSPRSNTTLGPDNTPNIRTFKLADTSPFALTNVSTFSGNYSNTVAPNLMWDGGILLGDFQGNAIRLGRPRTLVVNHIVEPAIILNAPPVGFDVIGDSTYNICDAYPINGSSDDFYSQLIQGTSKGIEVSTETHSSWGVSSTLSAGGEFLGIGVKASFTAKYGQNFNNTVSNDSVFKVISSSQAQWDDLIYATVTNYDIWEYPVYADGVLKGHVMAAIPRGKEYEHIYSNDLEGDGTGIILNHEPGNLLSYPNYADVTKNPDVSKLLYNLGPEPIIAQSSPAGFDLEWSSIKDTNTENTMNYGFSASASAEGWGWSFETEGNYDHQAVKTHTTTITSNIDMIANFGTLYGKYYSDAGYSITPYAYWSREGALVLDYTVKLTGTFWQEHYSQYPDLTFNCYYRYFNQMGLGGLSSETADWTKEIQIFPSTPKEGDTVTVLAEIHNYSLKADTSQVQVRFYLGSSENGGKPVLDLNGDSVFTTSSPVAARGDQIINFKWKVPNGLVSSDSILYAVIDPDNKIPELKEDNNVGWNHINILNVTSVSPTKSNQISNYILSQNYPNPFNPVTRINYQIPKLSHVTIKVYNILGQEVATLVNEEKMAGNYSVEFNATRFASGVYFYRMQAGDFVSTKKLILLK